MSTGPSTRKAGVKPSAGVTSVMTSSTSPRSPPSAGWARWCRAKMVERIRRIVSSRSWMAPVRRAAAVAPDREPLVSGGRVAAMLCSASPVANSRWMTWSCRSAAIRSRSSMSRTACCGRCARRSRSTAMRGLVGETRRQVEVVAGRTTTPRAGGRPAGAPQMVPSGAGQRDARATEPMSSRFPRRSRSVGNSAGSRRVGRLHGADDVDLQGAGQDPLGVSDAFTAAASTDLAPGARRCVQGDHRRTRGRHRRAAGALAQRRTPAGRRSLTAEQVTGERRWWPASHCCRCTVSS